ncbi:TYRO protein tyrosine kinase-binding protein isoform X1 [Anguilla rostrata]|uniref:TYRO protein tyrosine kinase-binding protein isoform X1 n=1 Tax=Anguilla rostrata TaxID=7938 RepID=UPI0030D61908
MTRSLCIATPFAGLFGPVVGQQDCRSCIHLEIGTVVGIIVADVVLTLLIALSVFFFVSRLRKRTRLEALEIKGKTQTVSMRKKPETESPYQELQGVQEDVYNDLRQFQK